MFFSYISVYIAMYIILDNIVQHLYVQRHYIIDPRHDTDTYFFKAFKIYVAKRMQNMYLDIREGLARLLEVW